MSYNFNSSYDKICFLILNRYKGLTLNDVIICNAKIESTENVSFDFACIMTIKLLI